MRITRNTIAAAAIALVSLTGTACGSSTSHTARQATESPANSALCNRLQHVTELAANLNTAADPDQAQTKATIADDDKALDDLAAHTPTDLRADAQQLAADYHTPAAAFAGVDLANPANKDQVTGIYNQFKTVLASNEVTRLSAYYNGNCG